MTSQTSKWTKLCGFLQAELSVPTSAIAFGLSRCEQKLNLLPISLWQYGLVTLEQLDQIFDWLEAS
jgi:hypothetical protein